MKAENQITTSLIIDSNMVRKVAKQTADPEAVFNEALSNSSNDASLLFSDDVIAALRTIRQKNEAAYYRLVVKAKGHQTKLDRLTSDVGNDDTDGSNKVINEIKAKHTVGHDLNGNGVVVIQDGQIRKTYYIDSQGFIDWFRAKCYEISGLGISDNLLTSSLSTLTAIGVHDGQELVVHMRSAKHGEDYYIDLCNDQWESIRINKDGWKIMTNPPVLFVRNKNMRSLPMPVKRGNLKNLWSYLNVPTNMHFLILPWIIDCFRPDTPYPILEIYGVQGSAKSTTQKRLRELIDPNQVLLRGRPKTVEDIYVSARNNALVSFENLSNLTSEQQDAFCTLATGGGHAARQLYTNGEEFILEAKRPVVLNGINPVATQPDMIERAISIEAPLIPEDKRLDEQTIAKSWAKDYPAVFTAILDLFVLTLAQLPKVTLTHKLRMADFQLLGEAVAIAKGKKQGYFSEIYSGTLSEGSGRSLETYGIVNAIQVLLNEQPRKFWEGNFLALKTALEATRGTDRSNWPRSARGLSGQLKRLEPSLRGMGIEVKSVGRTDSGQQIQLTLINFD